MFLSSKSLFRKLQLGLGLFIAENISDLISAICFLLFLASFLLFLLFGLFAGYRRSQRMHVLPFWCKVTGRAVLCSVRAEGAHGRGMARR